MLIIALIQLTRNCVLRNIRQVALMITRWDVLIIGGGPGGLAAAETAAKAGAKVAVCEQSNAIGSPIRTTGGSFIRDLHELGIPPELYHPIRRCRFIAPNEEVTFEYDKPTMCVIDVRGTFQFLAERAIEAGAKIFLNHRAVAPIIDKGSISGARIYSGKGQYLEFGSKVLIDASGYRAAMLTKADLYAGCKHFGAGAEYDFYAPNCDQDEAVLIVGNKVAPSGYGWAFPWGKNRVRVGIGILHTDAKANPSEFLATFISNSAEFHINLDGAQPLEYHFGLVPAEGLLDTLVGDGIMAVGDAAGQASALVGEGIRWAIRAGAAAGTVSAEAIQANDFSKHFLRKYQKQWRESNGIKLRIAYEINRKIANWDDYKWDEKTGLLKALSPQQFSEALSSNFTAGLLLDVVFSHPEFLKQGFRQIFERAGRLVKR
jgi:digeranylgeranylglycerophospholipid reductase